MGRTRINAIYEYYKYDDATKKSKCLIDGCSALLKGRHGANLLRHFYFRHKKEYIRISERNKQKSFTTKDRVLQNVMDLVTVHERPVALLDDEAFLKIISMIPMPKGSIAEIRELVKKRAGVRTNRPLPLDSATTSRENNRGDTPEPNDTSTINYKNEEQTFSVDFECMEPNDVQAKTDPLDDKAASDSQSTLDSSEEEEYAAPVHTEVLSQKSRVRERRRSDIVRKNNAIAEYYEAKKMKVHLEIKKLQLEIGVSTKRRTNNTNETNHVSADIKTETD